MFKFKIAFLSFLFCTTVSLCFFVKLNTVLNHLSLFYMQYTCDTFSILLIITTGLTLALSLLIVDNKYSIQNVPLYALFTSFIMFIVGLVQSTNMVSFFIFYEFLLLPSFILVKCSSPNRRSNAVSNYFLLWTQFGSFLVLLGLFLIVLKNQNIFFSNYMHTDVSPLIQVLIFFGFGIKIPLWPFHFWLSKTHVEANTGFSIFLSGILVKAAVFGLYKFIPIFNTNLSWFFVLIAIISIFDASLKMCTQVDLKKLVAVSTIQEMGFMIMLLLFFSASNYQVLFCFVFFHTFISGLFFYIVDCIYKRYNTRISYNIGGICNLFPNFSFFIFLSIYLFLGLPLTIKFSIEIYILQLFLNYNLFVFIIMIILNYASVVFFFKTFLLINFGSNQFMLCADLTKKEFCIIFLLVLSIILLNYM